MQYNGKYNLKNLKNFANILTYPVSQRKNKVKLENLIDISDIKNQNFACDQEATLTSLANAIIDAHKQKKPVICLSGAHLIKNGLGPIIIDLIKQGMISLFATNGAGIIHDYELALIGETSEHVPNGLAKGSFGMARELSYINAALSEGNEHKLGYGESIGNLICDEKFRSKVEKRLHLKSPIEFKYPQASIIAACHQNNVPLTTHVGIGTDVIDQHQNFDPQAKGGCSGRDFLIFADMITQLSDGGVVLNIGSAITGPEVLLKAISIASNIGKPARKIITADFDLKPYNEHAMTDESHASYYFRHHKSVVTRIPEALGGQGFYVQGNQKITIPNLYKKIITLLGK